MEGSLCPTWQRILFESRSLDAKRKEQKKESVQVRGKAEREGGGETNRSQDSYAELWRKFAGDHALMCSTVCPQSSLHPASHYSPTNALCPRRTGLPTLGAFECPIHYSAFLSLYVNYADTPRGM